MRSAHLPIDLAQNPVIDVDAVMINSTFWYFCDYRLVAPQCSKIPVNGDKPDRQLRYIIALQYNYIQQYTYSDPPPPPQQKKKKVELLTFKI